MSVSIEEAIQRLKGEILAQDWRISPKRAARLEEALSCLKERYKSRKATFAMLKMAESVLEYIKKYGGQPSETIDFLKEAMAHVVSLHEDLQFVPEKEEQIFKSLFRRFNKLKDRVKVKKPVSHSPQPAQMVEPVADLIPPKPASPPQEKSTPPASPANQSNQPRIAGQNAERLIEDLRNSLERAGEVGSTIGQILAELLAKEGHQPISPHFPTTAPEEESLIETPADLPTPSPVAQPANRKAPQPLKPCPPTEIIQFSTGGVPLAIQTNLVAATRKVAQAKLKQHVAKGAVPLKEFSRFMQKLSSQFKGSLATIKDSKLKELSLPILIPQSLELPERPDDQASHIMVVSNGNWHGIFICTTIQQEPKFMVKFQKMKNGDIAGTGFLEKGEEILLLDTLAVLRREGFLLMP